MSDTQTGTGPVTSGASKRVREYRGAVNVFGGIFDRGETSWPMRFVVVCDSCGQVESGSPIDGTPCSTIRYALRKWNVHLREMHSLRGLIDAVFDDPRDRLCVRCGKPTVDHRQVENVGLVRVLCPE